MKMKATSTPTDQCPEGVYAGTLKEIKEWIPSSDSQYGSDPQLLWVVLIRKVIHANPVRATKANPEPMQPEDWVTKELWGFTSQMLTPKAKARQWIEGILDRELEEDEEVDLEDLFGSAVTINVGRSTTGKHKVMTMTRYVKGAPVQAPMSSSAEAFADEPAPSRTLVAAGRVPDDDVGFEDAGSDELPF